MLQRIMLTLFCGTVIGTFPRTPGVSGTFGVSEPQSGTVSFETPRDKVVLLIESTTENPVEGTLLRPESESPTSLVTPPRDLPGTGSPGPSPSLAITLLDKNYINTKGTHLDLTLPEVITTSTPGARESASTATLDGGDQKSAANNALAYCTCDLKLGTCDLNCCCDLECGLSDPATVFSSCLPGSTKAVCQVCVDSTLIFRSNSPLHTETISTLGTTVQFCILMDDPHLNYFVQPQNFSESNFQTLTAQYGGATFIFPSQALPSFPAYYRAGDPILTFFNASATLGVLRQPVPVGAGGGCVDRNPAGFLENRNTSCVRQFKNLKTSCISDPVLNAVFYYQNITVLKVPNSVMNNIQTMQVPVSSSELRTPTVDGSSCNNVVSQVTYEIVYNGTQGIQNISAIFILTNISGDPGASLQQHFNLLFRSVQQNLTSSAAFLRSGNPGYITGTPVLTSVSDSKQPVTIMQSFSNGMCSDRDRSDVLFGFNMKAGCWIRTESETCSAFHDHLYQTLRGKNSPELLAMFGNADPRQSQDWTRVMEQNCSMQAQGNCSSDCFVPISLEIQVLWAEVGLQSNPQAQIVGASYKYLCKLVPCQDPVALTTSVSFIHMKHRPEPPQGQPGVDWKLPFDFFFPFKAALSSGQTCGEGYAGFALLLTLILCHGLNM
ncbi:tectonic-3 isoform X2 [Microcaecilia unicolor]|uniref:Tectonic-3 isoform X2 n=1 Tax=Microcaecilia unicolor TaxID=1415580 RepID=A0A6P7YHU4_9AMPH|nr:tectonic-3 isoform X2 [Microcaecilia unicolor]